MTPKTTETAIKVLRAIANGEAADPREHARALLDRIIAEKSMFESDLDQAVKIEEPVVEFVSAPEHNNNQGFIVEATLSISPYEIKQLLAQALTKHILNEMPDETIPEDFEEFDVELFPLSLDVPGFDFESRENVNVSMTLLPDFEEG